MKKKVKLLDQLSVERGMNNNSYYILVYVVMVTELSERLDNELRELKVTHQLLKEQNDDLRRKMNFFIKVSIEILNIISLQYNLVGEHCGLG